jgi:3-phosphoshikimate 1-carboxyvinyltransferase
MGAHFTYDAVQNTVHVQGPAALHGTSIDVNSCIDSLPILATLGCYAQGETRLYNAAIARGKECDRISSMAVELKRMGAHIQEMPDGLVIQGQTGLHGAEMHSHGDHRTAMALSVAALAAKGPSRILDSHCVAKTYGQFAQDLAQLGVQIEVIP